MCCLFKSFPSNWASLALRDTPSGYFYQQDCGTSRRQLSPTHANETLRALKRRISRIQRQIMLNELVSMASEASETSSDPPNLIKSKFEGALNQKKRRRLEGTGDKAEVIMTVDMGFCKPHEFQVCIRCLIIFIGSGVNSLLCIDVLDRANSRKEFAMLADTGKMPARQDNITFRAPVTQAPIHQIV